MNGNRQHTRKCGAPRFFVFSMILCLGSGIVFGQREKTKEEPDEWTVRLLYREEDPEQKTHWKTKKELKATFSSGTLLFQEGDTPFLEIPAAGIRTLFYDKAPQKKLLQDLTEPQGPVFRAVDNKRYLGAQIGLGAYAVGWVSVVSPAVYVSSGSFLAPAAVFPPALIAVGGIVAIQMLKHPPEHFVHLIWEDEGSPQGVAIGLRKKQRTSLVAALEAISGKNCLNLPEERKRLEAEIKAQKSSRHEFLIHERVVFGPLDLKKRDETYKLVLLERKDGPSELYFFCPSVSMKSLRGVALVEVEQGESLEADFQKNRDRRSIVSVKHGAGTEPRSIEEFQLGARRVRPVAFVDAGEPPGKTNP